MEGRTHRLLAIPAQPRLERVLRYMLDENEFLSPHGIRSLSRVHGGEPCMPAGNGAGIRVEYEPGEVHAGLFGGNSNWRGPVWFPVNYLLVEALERYHHFYGDELRVECPTGSGRLMNLQQVARELAGGWCASSGPMKRRRPCYGSDVQFVNDPHWRDLLLFHEYFHGENGRGLGANHQTGWTALVVRLLEDEWRTAQPAKRARRVSRTRRRPLRKSPHRVRFAAHREARPCRAPLEAGRSNEQGSRTGIFGQSAARAHTTRGCCAVRWNCCRMA